MRRIQYHLKRNTGASTVMVLVVACVLVILGSALGFSIVQGYKIVRAEETVVYAFTGAHAAVERSFLNIYKKFSDPSLSYFSSIVWPGDDTLYVDDIITRMNDNIASNPFNRQYNDIEVFESSTQPKVEADIVFSRNRNVSVRRSADGSKLIIPIALTVKASLQNGLFASYGRTVYAYREFALPVPNKFNLKAAIYSIGDVMAINGISADVSGDVNAFGTSPLNKRQVNQYSYTTSLKYWIEI